MSNILNRRNENSEAILKDRFIRQQLTEESRDIDKAQESLMARRGFESRDFYNKRSFKVDDTTMTYTHLPKHRFVDMRSRNTKKGRVKKKSHPIHNRILYGHANNIIKRLHYGYTEAVKEELRSMDLG